MKTRDQETRERLLTAAARLFAARGFKKVTVREICGAARANVAAVNYHFGDKLGLYRSVVQLAVDEMRAINDEARQAGEGRSPVDKLRSFVEVYVRRTATRDVWIPQIVTREVADRTAAVDLIVERVLRPRQEYLAEIVAAILECAPDEERVSRCVTSVQAQCMAFVQNPVTARLQRGALAGPEAIPAVAEHVMAFSLAGIRASSQTNGRRPKAVAARRRGADKPARVAR